MLWNPRRGMNAATPLQNLPLQSAELISYFACDTLAASSTSCRVNAAVVRSACVTVDALLSFHCFYPNGFGRGLQSLVLFSLNLWPNVTEGLERFEHQRYIHTKQMKRYSVTNVQVCLIIAMHEKKKKNHSIGYGGNWVQWNYCAKWRVVMRWATSL